MIVNAHSIHPRRTFSLVANSEQEDWCEVCVRQVEVERVATGTLQQRGGLHGVIAMPMIIRASAIVIRTRTPFIDVRRTNVQMPILPNANPQPTGRRDGDQSERGYEEPGKEGVAG